MLSSPMPNSPVSFFMLSPKRIFWLVLAVALVIRGVYMLQLTSSPLYDYPVVDGKTYVLHAESLAQGNWLGHGQGPFWQPPLYPYFLGLVKTVFPQHFFGATRFLQALIGALACAFTGLLGCRLFSPKVGLAAGLAAAFYGTLIFFDGELLPANLAVFLNAAGLLLLHRALQRGSTKTFAASGLVFGLAALAVPTVLVFVPLAAGWIYQKRRSLPAVAALLLGTAAAVAPVTLRNYTVGGDTVLISFNSGINFFIGNNADYHNTLRTRPGWEWDDLAQQPARQGIKRPTEKSAYFWRQSWDYISTNPLGYTGLLARKSLQLLHGDEWGRNQDIYYWRQYSSLLAATLWKWGLAFPFGLIGPLALVGLALALRRRGLDPTLLFVLAYSVGIIAFFPTARYRTAMLPVLLPLASYAFWWLLDTLRSDRLRQALLPLAALVVLGIAANYDVGTMDMEGDAEIHYNLGQAYAHKRQAEAAHRAYAQSVELDTTYWQAWVNLGSIKAIQGQMAPAATIFERVTQAKPERPEAWVNLAHSRMGLRQYTAAARAYEQALTVHPHQPRIYVELMQLHVQRGAIDAARQVLEQALKRYPRDHKKLRSIFTQMQRR
jgi:tetratricopeptide (TPR) repeat protein